MLLRSRATRPRRLSSSAPTLRPAVAGLLAGLLVPVVALPLGAATATPVADAAYEFIDVDLEQATQIHSDAAGNLYVYDLPRNVILQITPDGATRVVVGNGQQGTIQAGPATETPLGWVEDMAVAPDGTIHLVDHTSYAVASVTPWGDLRLIGEWWGTTSGVGVDAAGNLYVADCGNHTISRISPDGATTVLLDRASDVPGWQRQFFPETIEVTPDGSVIVEDTGNRVLDLIAPDGTTSVFAGTGEDWDRPLPGPATETTVYVSSMEAASDGTLYFLGHPDGVGRITADGELSLLRLPKDESGEIMNADTLGLTADGRLALTLYGEPGLWLIDPADLSTYDPRVPEDPWGGKMMPQFGASYRGTIKAGRPWVADVRLYDYDTGTAATGTVHLVLKGKATPPIALVDGRARIRATLPWKRGTRTVRAVYSGDDSFIERDQTFEVKIEKRKKKKKKHKKKGRR